MKYTLFAAFMLLSISAFAQAQITKDSTAIRFVSGAFYEDRFLEYDNNDKASLSTFIGDTATLNNYETNKAILSANNFAAIANQFVNQQKTVNEIRDVKNAVAAATGLDLHRAMNFLYYQALVDTVAVNKDWDYRTDGITTQIQIRLLSGGTIRFANLPGAGGFKFAHLLGDSWLRINDYPTGKDTHFYKARSGRWFNYDKSIELRKTAQ